MGECQRLHSEIELCVSEVICGPSPWQWLYGDLESTCRFWREGKAEISLDGSPGERWGSP